MTFRPLTKEDVGITTWSAEKAVMIAHVRSAVEGLKEYLLKKSEDEHKKSIAYGEGTSSDFWDAKHIATFEAMECVDMWFPVFVEDSLSPGSSENVVHVKELSNSVSGATTIIGCAATESVANSEGRQQSMATCCRQQSEGSSPSPSSSHSQPSESGTANPQPVISVSNKEGLNGAACTSELKKENKSSERDALFCTPKHAPCKGCQAHTIGCCPNCGCGCECHKKEGEEK